ncbi:hypothetical protein B0H17DRAFT_1328566 [Mycena rosella]|uniref:Uncharacterized protein n=1 Tax=Mycena rosella TaxID=1033263 RepID=A0AAD7DTE8_MYCRO|nr:hypothetical protein B0H17DRAFT_1328566 [Mycena rosella]
MAIDPDSPGRKTVFKVNTDKLPTVRTLRRLVRTVIKSVPPEKTLFHSAPAVVVYDYVAGSCWHFGRSTERSANNKQRTGKPTRFSRRSTSKMRAPGSFSLQDRLGLAEDWVEIHSLEEARTWALHISDPTIDFHSQHFRFHLKFLPESEGIPSTSFILVDAEVYDHSALGVKEATTLASMPPLIESAITEERVAGTAGFLEMFPCFYWIDDVQIWTSVFYR